MSRLRALAAALILLVISPAAYAQCVSLTTIGSAYGQNFDSLSNTAGSTTNNLTIPGWFLTEAGGGTRDNEQYAVDTGASGTGDTFSYGSAGSTDRALGQLRSGTLISTIGGCFTNNTGATITSLDINYFGEQWRIGITGAARDDRMDFQYSTDATSLTTGTWLDHNALDFTNIVKTNTTAGALNGNTIRTNLVSSVPSLSIANGATFWIRWSDIDAAGADDGLAVDDFFLTAQGAPPPPTISIDDVTQSEGNAGTTTFTFTVSLSSPAQAGGVTFDIATADNSATTADNDYATNSLTGQTIAAGNSTYTFNVTVNGDVSIESPETFFVNLTNIVGATAGDIQGTGTILNDDSPTLSIDDVTLSEGASGTTTYTFTVSLSQPAGPGGVTFDIATADNTATTADGDYVANSLTGQTIAAGNNSYTFNVTVNGDNNVEPTETFFVNVTNLAGATAGDVQGLGTITTDEPQLTINNVTQAETNAGTTTFTFTVSLDIPAPAGGISFDIATAPGSATAGVDYVHQALTGQSIPAGSSSYTFNVTVNGDVSFEPNETFFVNVTNVSAGVGVADGQGLGTITNDDTAPAFTIADVAVTEGQSGTQIMTFTVSLSGTRDSSFDVNVATADSSATVADADYVANATTLTFTPADTTKTFDVVVNGDTNSEGNEQFFVNLSGATGGAVISDAQALGIIRLDDPFSVAAVDTPYVENFDTLAQTTAATTPVGWTQSESGASSNSTYGAGTGSSTTGDTYSFGVAATNPITDRAFGGLQSGSLIPTIGAFYRNDTGTTITSLSIQYTGEEWRLGTAGRADRLDFQYSVDATSLTTGTWIDADTLDFSTPNQTGTGAKDGNAAANRAARVFTISSLSIAPGQTFWVRFTDFNASGSDDGLAIDDFSLIANFAGAFININDVTQFEGNAGTTVYTFTVSLTQPAPAGGVTFDITTQDNTASSASDYVANTLAAQTIPAGSTSYSFNVNVNGDTTPEGHESFFVNISNITNALAADTQGVGTLIDDDTAITLIHDVQGAGASSPIVGSNVTIRGIVTGVKSNGFFVQEEDADADADPATSEGVFVFTSITPPAAAVMGAQVLVSGTVAEFVPSSDPQQPPFTELTSSSTVQISTGNPLPTPVLLTNAFPSPAGAFDQLERVESMRVQVNSLTVSGPTDGSFTEITGATSHTGRFFGVVTGTPRPFREPGIQAPDVPSSGSIPPIPRWDFNPERLKVDSNALGAGSLIVKASDVVTNLVGPLEYGFRAYAILPDGTLTSTVTPGVLATTTTVPLPTEATVASFNLNRLFNSVADGSGPTVNATVYQNRLAKASVAIRNQMHMPDIVGVQEVENLATLQDLANRINNDAVAAVQPNPMYVAYLIEGNDVGGIDVGYLVKTAPVNVSGLPRVSVSSVVQELDGSTWIDPRDNQPATLHDRPPLVLNATVNHPSGVAYGITVINNHLRSLLGIESDAPDGLTTEGARVRGKRLAQAQDLANLVQGYQTADPARNIILVGDFNAFEFNDGFVDVINTITGTPPPDNETVVPGDGIDLVNPDLDNLVDTPPAPERYSYVHDGNAQNIDHAIVNQAFITSTTARRIEHPRIDADYPETDRNNPATPIRISDHDPVLAYFSPAIFVSSAISIGDASVLEGNAGTTLLSFNVTLDAASAGTITVNYSTSDITALAGSDYAAESGTVTFLPGDVSETITIDVSGDPFYELDETFAVTLSNNTGNSTIFDGSAIGTIQNDDPITVSVADTNVVEGNAGTSALTFTVTLSNAHTEPITVNYATSDGSATAGVDYTAAAGTITFAPGDVSETITVLVNGDVTFETDETVLVTLTNPVGAFITDGEATGTIINDDGVSLIAIGDATAVEGSALTFTVTLNVAAATDVTVNYTTSNGTATAGTDYTAASGSLTFAPGDMSETITINTTADSAFEADETLFVTLSSPSANAGISDAEATGTIVNDDVAAAALAVTLNVSAAPVVAQPFTKTITITNNGPDPATNVVFADDLPAGLTLVSATTTQGVCNAVDPVVCQVGTIANGGSVTITLTVEAAAAGDYTNSVTVTSTENVAGVGDSETFTVTPAEVPAIPTLSEFVLFALLGLLAMMGAMKLR